MARLKNKYVKSNTSIILMLLLVLTACIYLPAVAGPQGGDVVGGVADITRPDALTTSILQQTDKAIINWDGFNIDVNELVNFIQPGTDSVALNRVTGVDPSSILGQLLANGRVFLVNPNGIVFGPGSKVDVGALVATTFDLKDDDFLSGNYDFLQKPGDDPSYIINKGQIKVADNGFVFLVAPGVKNEGLIIANIGKVVLGSGDKFTVDFQGDGLITYEISGKVTEKVKGPDGTPLTSVVSNTGKISSNGGEVVLTGDAAKEVVSSVINQEGVIEAKSLVSSGGSVKLIGGSEGIVQNLGTIDVSADEAGAKTGEVSISGDYVGNFGTILAKGAEDAKGGNITLSSTTQTLDSSASLVDVSGGINSDGGNIFFLSDTSTTVNGTLLARGGELGGNGGFAEVSSKGGFILNSILDARAAYGKTGMLLIDPADVNIHSIGAASLTDVDQFTDDPPGSIYIHPTTINGALSNVTIQANNDIYVSEPIDIAMAGVGLTLQAGRTIYVGQNIATNDGAITLTANDSHADLDYRTAGGGSIFGYDITIDAGNAPVTLSVDAAGAEPGMIDIASIIGKDIIINSVGDLILRGTYTAQDLISLESSASGVYAPFSTITATDLLVKAAGGIGDGQYPLRTTVDNFAADAGIGGVYIVNTKDINIATIGSVSGVNGSDISITAPTITLGTDAVTQTGVGQVYLDGAVLLDGDANLNANGNIMVEGTIDSDSDDTPRGLTITSDSGSVTVTGAIGADSALSSLTIAGEGVILDNIGGDSAGVTGATSVTLDPATSLNLTGTTYNAHQQTYTSGDGFYGIVLNGGGPTTFTSNDGALSFSGNLHTFGQNLTVNAGSGSVTFNDPISGTGNLVVNSTGDAIFNGVGNYSSLTSFTTDAGGRTIINNDGIHTLEGQTYNDDLVLNGAPVDIGTAVDAPITFNGTIDGASNFRVFTWGQMTFNGAIGATTPLTSFVTGPLGAVTLNTGSVNTIGDQIFYGKVTLGTPTTTLTSSEAGNMFFLDTVDGASDFTVNTAGPTVFYDAVGNLTPLTSITTNTGGYTMIGMADITTTGAQTYGDDVYATGGTSSSFTSTGDADITFNEYLLGGETNLTINTAGTTTFNDIVFADSLTTDAGGTTIINGVSVGTYGAQTYNDDVTLGGPQANISSSYGGDVTFNGTINGVSDLNVNTEGTTFFNGAVGDTTALTSIYMGSYGTTEVNGGVVNTTGNQTYVDPVIIGADTTLNSDDGDMFFIDTINGAYALSVNTAGSVIFGGDIGGLTPLTALDATCDYSLTSQDIMVDGGDITLAAGDTVNQLGNISTSGTGNVSITAGAGNIIMYPWVSTTVENGNITYSSEGDMVLNEITANGGNITLTAAGGIYQNGDISNNGTGNVSVTAVTDDIDMSGGASTTVENGNVTYSAQGDIWLNELTTATTGPGGLVTLITQNGNIIDVNGSAPNITANNVTVNSPNDELNNIEFLRRLINLDSLPYMIIGNNRVIAGTVMDGLFRATSTLDYYMFRRYGIFPYRFVEGLLNTPNTWETTDQILNYVDETAMDINPSGKS